MRLPTLLACAILLSLTTMVSAHTVSVTKPTGNVRVGDDITISLRVTPTTGSPIRGGGADITFDARDFELVGVSTNGSANAAVARPGSTNPYKNSAPPAWYTSDGVTARLQVPIIPATAQLGTTFTYSGTVATFHLKAKRERTGTSVTLTTSTKVVPGSTSLTSLTFDILAEASNPPTGSIACPLDNNVNSNDAVAVLQYLVNMPNVFSCFTQACNDSPPNCWFPPQADVNHDGSLDTNDAREILHKYADPTYSFPDIGFSGSYPSCPCDASKSVQVFEKAIPIGVEITSTRGVTGSDVQVGIRVSDKVAVDGFRLGIEFDPTAFSYVDGSAEFATGMLAVNPAQPGQLLTAGVRAEGAESESSLLVFRLAVSSEAPAGKYAIKILNGGVLNGGSPVHSTDGLVVIEQGTAVRDWTRFEP